MNKSCCVPIAPDADRLTPGLPAKAGPPAQPGVRGEETAIVWLEGGRSYSGTHQPMIDGDGEARRETRVHSFGIERFAVTNRRFAAFVNATGYKTEAEHYGWSFVFKDALTPDSTTARSVVNAPWWYRVDGSDWRHPAGPGTTIEEILDHPVVHVSWTDAAEFAAWSGGRLLSENEWEFAARGGGENTYPWGDDDPPDDAPRCNIWQGSFPDTNTVADGHSATAPVDAFEPNGFGLYNMAGNAWEWCFDPFRTRSLTRSGKARDREARRNGERVLKGGSYLCHRSYCHRYRIAARIGLPADSTSAHAGFRIGYDWEKRSRQVM